MKISIDTGKFKLPKREPDKKGLLPLSDTDEKILKKVIEAKAAIQAVEDDLKEKMAARLQEMGPNVTGFRGVAVKIGYRFFGAKYRIDDTLVSQLDPAFYSSKTSYSPQTKAIEKFEESTGNLPLGVDRRDRNKTITIKSLEDKEDEV